MGSLQTNLDVINNSEISTRGTLCYLCSMRVKVVYGITVILLGIAVILVACAGDNGHSRKPSRPATSEERIQHELERELDLWRACGEDRVTVPCDRLPTSE